MSPSGHNSQPWQISEKANTILLTINEDHFISGKESELLIIEPYVSLGAFIETLKLAGKGFGYKLGIKLFPDRSTIASIYIESIVEASTDLLKAIETRVSNRNPYNTTELDSSILNKISTNNFSYIKSKVVTKRKDIEFVANKSEEAIKSIMSVPKYRMELSEWVRTNKTTKYDGMPGFTHGTGFFLSLIAKQGVKHGSYGPQAIKSKKLIENSGAIIIVSCSTSNKEDYINSGRMYSQICILANLEGIATSALGASALDADTNDQLCDYFNINSNPIYIIRLGVPTKKSRHSPRWPIENIIRN